MLKKLVIMLALMLSIFGSQANASTITMTLPEFSGTSDSFPQYPYYEIGTFNFDLQGAEILSATLSGQWGNSIAKTTAHNVVYADSLNVANTYLSDQNPYNEYYVPWSYTFTDFLELLDGSLLVHAHVTSEYILRLGETTLNIETTPVPEPTSMLLGLMGVAGAARLRRSKKA